MAPTDHTGKNESLNAADNTLPPAEPRERQVTMFNRKAIVVLAAIAGMTVMVVSFALNTPRVAALGSDAPEAHPEVTRESGQRRNYLASPPDTASNIELARSSTNAGSELDLAEQLGVTSGIPGAAVMPGAVAELYDPYAGSAYPPQAWGPPVAAAPANAGPSPRELALERAMRCGIRSCPPERSLEASSAVPTAAEDYASLMMQEAVGALANAAGASATAARSIENFPPVASPGTASTVVTSQIEHPVSQYQIMAGTLIPVTLVTAINSDLPGQVIAQVTRNVYDTQQRHLLIPAGSKVLGRVDDQVGLGQARISIAWHRLILPNSSSLSLPEFGGVDGKGAAGIRDRVNNNYTRNFATVLLLSAITAGTQLSQPQAANVYTPPSAGQVAAGALGQQMGEVSSQLISRNMQVAPTLEVRPGFKFSIYVSQDLILAPYDHYPAR